jgi:hypothetical protein
MPSILTHWECHKVNAASPSATNQANLLLYQCSAGNKIKNTDELEEQKSERCRNNDCKHKRCKKCYDLDSNSNRIQHCDGSSIQETVEYSYVTFD